MLVAGCAGRAARLPGPGQGDETTPADTTTREGRLRVLDSALEILAENYVPSETATGSAAQRLREERDLLLAIQDPDTFYDSVNEVLRDAGNQHLYLYRPGRDLFNREADESRLIGATSREVDGYVFVDDVWEGGPAAEAGLQYGDELLPSNGHKPVLDPIPRGEERVRLWVRRAREREPFHLTIDSVEGDTLWYLTESTRASIRTIQMGACRIGVVHLRTFADEQLTEELVTGAQFDDADGLILDLRNNRGGEIRLAGELLDLLTREPSIWIQYRSRQYPFPATSWNRPLVVLVNGETRSAAEIFAAAVQARKLGPLVGSSTAGQVQGSRLFPLPDGSRLLVPITRVFLPDGSPLEGRGVAPDISVSRPLAYAEGEDPPMARAVQILSEQLACPEPLPPETFPQEELTPPQEGGTPETTGTPAR
jgi:C-terminal processing protease CtpA/Prc